MDTASRLAPALDAPYTVAGTLPSRLVRRASFFPMVVRTVASSSASMSLS